MTRVKKDPKSHHPFLMMKKSAKIWNDSKRLGGGEKWLKKRDKKNWRNSLRRSKNNRKY
tara:strand:+ start:527 stop:703 length:177 start_codon:yes stop_codon:yes gene_type:complete